MSGKTRNEASSSRKTSDNNGVFGKGESKVDDYGRNRSSCGYCRSPGRTSVSHGLLAHSLTVNDYQDLLDRGWRRSGSFLYKPEMEKTCCPSYTIRLQASAFVPSKEQLRVTRRLQRFLEGNLDSNTPLKLKEGSNASKESHSSANAEFSSPGVKECLSSKKTGEKILENLSDMIDNEVRKCIEDGDIPSDVRLPKASVKKVSQGKRKLFTEGSETLLYSSNIAFLISAAMKKLVEPGTKDVHQPGLAKKAVDEKDVSPKAMAEKLTSSLKQLAETIGVSAKACNGHINFYSSLNKVSIDTNAENATTSEVSADRQISEACSSQSASKQSLVKKRRRLEIHLRRSSFDPEEYALYKRYQIKVHNDAPDGTSVSEKSYKRFLVDSPLIFVPPTSDLRVPPCGFGSFHQQYVIDGKLVAVGVIDILPKCLSSKYLFWDPDYAFLSLGKYSALQEVNWVKENQVHCPSLQYYYLGYYIHSCSKMRYKATYRPSELLCPLRYQWVPFDIAKPSLDRQRYVILSDCAILQDGESSVPPNALQYEEVGPEHCNDVRMEPSEGESSDEEFDSDLESDKTENGDLTNMLIGMNGTKLKYKDVLRLFLPAHGSHLESMLRRYLRVVGQELGEKMVYSLG